MKHVRSWVSRGLGNIYGTIGIVLSAGKSGHGQCAVVFQSSIQTPLSKVFGLLSRGGTCENTVERNLNFLSTSL